MVNFPELQHCLFISDSNFNIFVYWLFIDIFKESPEQSALAHRVRKNTLFFEIIG